MNIQFFVKKNWSYIAIALIAIVLIVMLASYEGFVTELAEYPKVFTDKIATPFLKEATASFSSQFNPQPYMPEITQLNIESQIKSVMIDIGDGKAIEAPVHIPAQTVQNLEQQVVIKYEEPKETDVLVAAQVIQVPAQDGVISVEVSDAGDSIKVPVSIPAQTVTVPEQKAVEATMETFSI